MLGAECNPDHTAVSVVEEEEVCVMCAWTCACVCKFTFVFVFVHANVFLCVFMLRGHACVFVCMGMGIYV